MKLKNRSKVSTLIFDLGEVIVDLDVNKVVNDLAEYTQLNQEDITRLISEDAMFSDFETGRISSNTFLAGVNDTLQINLSEKRLTEIWNSMLKGIPIGKLQLLAACTKQYHTMIMSNTNELHEIAFNEMVSKVSGGLLMSDYVNNAYYSHKLGLRKPSKEVFEYLIETHQLNPENTVFFDDKLENIQAAKQTGIQAVLIKKPDDLYNHFS